MPFGSEGPTRLPVSGLILTETIPSGTETTLVVAGGSAALANSIQVSMGVVDPHSRFPTGALLEKPAQAVAAMSAL